MQNRNANKLMLVLSMVALSGQVAFAASSSRGKGPSLSSSAQIAAQKLAAKKQAEATAAQARLAAAASKVEAATTPAALRKATAEQSKAQIAVDKALAAADKALAAVVKLAPVPASTPAPVPASTPAPVPASTPAPTPAQVFEAEVVALKNAIVEAVSSTGLTTSVLATQIQGLRNFAMPAGFTAQDVTSATKAAFSSAVGLAAEAAFKFRGQAIDTGGYEGVLVNLLQSLEGSPLFDANSYSNAGGSLRSLVADLNTLRQ